MGFHHDTGHRSYVSGRYDMDVRTTCLVGFPSASLYWRLVNHSNRAIAKPFMDVLFRSDSKFEVLEASFNGLI